MLLDLVDEIKDTKGVMVLVMSGKRLYWGQINQNLRLTILGCLNSSILHISHCLRHLARS